MKEGQTRYIYRGRFVSEEESLLSQHISEHLKIVCAHLDDLFRGVDTDTSSTDLLQTLNTCEDERESN